jgi:glycosyltransferase involved in cell wall biosynthesis
MNASVKSSLPRQSNDFTSVESAFWQATDCALTRVAVSPSKAAAPRESVTIIIPSYNGWRTLPASLHALDAQQYRNFEVMIVDDCSSVPIAEALAANEHSFPMKYLLLEKNTGIGAARNAGLCCIEGDTVIFLDDDMRPPELTYAQALRQEFTERCLFVGFRENVASEVFFSEAAVCAKRRDAVAVGGFPEQGFENWGTEDLAFGARMVSLGFYHRRCSPARETAVGNSRDKRD